ncbi:PREDICTED: sialin-like, partial [Priapulus caudatus]|uniref:Sialin-like n=1 Tax=Priapulus caudatus TaxID=37621 RepID=A0ABM1EML9_PRICU
MGKQDNDTGPYWTSYRMQVVLLSFLMFVCFSMQRSDMSVAIVCMVNHTALQQEIPSDVTVSEQCRRNITQRQDPDGEFTWDKHTQGLILSSFFWGYIITQIPGGWLAKKYGPRWTYAGFQFSGAVLTMLCPLATRQDWRALLAMRFLIGLCGPKARWSFYGHSGLSESGGWLAKKYGPRWTYAGFQFSGAVLTMLCPLATRQDWRALLAMRFLIGLCGGAAWPCFSGLMGTWAPPNERSSLVSFGAAGIHIGIVLVLPIGSSLCHNVSWDSIFYVIGGAGCLTSLWYLYVVYDSPEEHPRISEVERNYIKGSLKGQVHTLEKAHKEIPWSKILTSPTVWLLMYTFMTYAWGLSMTLTNLPTFMFEVLKYDMKSNGLLSALPFISSYVAQNISGALADFAMSRDYLSRVWVRRIWTAIGLTLDLVALQLVYKCLHLVAVFYDSLFPFDYGTIFEQEMQRQQQEGAFDLTNFGAPAEVAFASAYVCEEGTIDTGSNAVCSTSATMELPSQGAKAGPASVQNPVFLLPGLLPNRLLYRSGSTSPQFCSCMPFPAYSSV